MLRGALVLPQASFTVRVADAGVVQAGVDVPQSNVTVIGWQVWKDVDCGFGGVVFCPWNVQLQR